MHDIPRSSVWPPIPPVPSSLLDSARRFNSSVLHPESKVHGANTEDNKMIYELSWITILVTDWVIVNTSYYRYSN